MSAERLLHLYGLELLGPYGTQWLMVAGMTPLDRAALTQAVAEHIAATHPLPADWSPRRQLRLLDEPLLEYDTDEFTFYAIRTTEEEASPDLLEGMAAHGQTVILARPIDDG